jgi:hypothetical protein
MAEERTREELAVVEAERTPVRERRLEGEEAGRTLVGEEGKCRLVGEEAGHTPVGEEVERKVAEEGHRQAVAEVEHKWEWEERTPTVVAAGRTSVEEEAGRTYSMEEEAGRTSEEAGRTSVEAAGRTSVEAAGRTSVQEASLSRTGQQPVIVLLQSSSSPEEIRGDQNLKIWTMDTALQITIVSHWFIGQNKEKKNVL